MTLTFTRFLRRQRRREDPVGDLARDWIADVGRGKPRGAYKLPALLRYLEDRNACQGALDAAEHAWREWQATFPRNSPRDTPR
jgi:hypothetical protein